MKEITWHVAKVRPRDQASIGGIHIDFWNSAKTRHEAMAFVDSQGGDGNPFNVVRITVEVMPKRQAKSSTSPRRAKKRK